MTWRSRIVLSVAEVAELTPLSPKQIRERLQDPSHPLRGFLDRGLWMVYAESLEEWLGGGETIGHREPVDPIVAEILAEG